jgi:hypothetical protein
MQDWLQGDQSAVRDVQMHVLLLLPLLVQTAEERHAAAIAVVKSVWASSRIAHQSNLSCCCCHCVIRLPGSGMQLPLLPEVWLLHLQTTACAAAAVAAAATANAVQAAEERHAAAIAALKSGWASELKRQQAAWEAGAAAKQEAWRAAKTAEIKEQTVKVRLKAISMGCFISNTMEHCSCFLPLVRGVDSMVLKLQLSCMFTVVATLVQTCFFPLLEVQPPAYVLSVYQSMLLKLLSVCMCAIVPRCRA